MPFGRSVVHDRQCWCLGYAFGGYGAQRALQGSHGACQQVGRKVHALWDQDKPDTELILAMSDLGRF
jgi:hypothetical protein